MNDYIHALEERQQLINDQQEVAVPEPGSVVLLKGEKSTLETGARYRMV